MILHLLKNVKGLGCLMVFYSDKANISPLYSNFNVSLERINGLRKMLMRSKRNSISAALEENRADPRRFWRVINEDLGIGKKAGSSSCTKIRSGANFLFFLLLFSKETL